MLCLRPLARPVYLYAASLPVPHENLRLGEGMEHRFVTLDEVSCLSPRAPAYHASLRDARQA